MTISFKNQYDYYNTNIIIASQLISSKYFLTAYEQ